MATAQPDRHAWVILQHIGPRGPLAADSPMVTSELPCWLCFGRFKVADSVTLCMMEPVDPYAPPQAPTVKTVEGRPTHWGCLMQFLGKSAAAAADKPPGTGVDRN